MRYHLKQILCSPWTMAVVASGIAMSSAEAQTFNFDADTPGSLRVNLGELPYRHLRRPLWPLDQG